MSSLHQRMPSGEFEDEPGAGTMGFLEHLDELRTRIIRSILAVGVGMGIAFFFHDRLADFVLEPTLRSLPPGSQLIIIRPGEGFSFYFNVSLIGGVVLAAPFVAFEVWRFIAPGLHVREKKLAIPFILLASLGCIGGALFSHYLVFPATMAFFGTFDSPHIKYTPRIEDTFDQYLRMLLGMVVVFQLPVVVLFLARMGMVTATFLWQHIKYAILIIFVVAAVLTPSPDPYTQTLFAAPMLGLYVLCIAIAWMAAPRRKEMRRPGSTHLRLVVAAAVLDQAQRRRGGRLHSR